MKKERFLSLLLTAILPITMLSSTGQLAGCATKQTDDVVKLSYSLWGDERCEAVTKQTIEEFEKIYPNIHVSYIMNPRTATVKADIMQVTMDSAKYVLKNNKFFADFRDYADIVDLSPYKDYELQLMTGNEEIRGIPISWDGSIMIYNQDIYDKFNLDIPRTWDDLLYAGYIMRAKDVYPLYSDVDRLMSLLIAREECVTGKDAFGPDGAYQYGEEEEQDIRRFYRELIHEKAVAPVNLDWYDFLECGEAAGCIASLVDHDKEIKAIREAGGHEVVGPLIVDEEDNSLYGVIQPYGFYCIDETSAHTEEAALFVNYLINSKENAMIERCVKGVPINDNAEYYLISHSLMDADVYPICLMINQYLEDLIVNEVANIGDYVYGFRK